MNDLEYEISTGDLYNSQYKQRGYCINVVFWHGSNEPYPRKSARLLKEYLPKLEVVEFDDMGHGQYLHEHSVEYAAKFIEYLEA